jgi:hypothetical protein
MGCVPFERRKAPEGFAGSPEQPVEGWLTAAEPRSLGARVRRCTETRRAGP